jgi:hydrogenase maturation protease
VKTLVLGLGNPILTDDGIGVHVARALSKCYQRDDVTIAEASIGGLRLLDTLAGHDRAVLVDAIQTPGGQPGQVYRLGPKDLRASLHSGSTHDLSLPGTLTLGRGLGMKLPEDEDIVIIAVEVKDVLTFGEACTERVQAAVPQALQIVLHELQPVTPRANTPLEIM